MSKLSGSIKMLERLSLVPCSSKVYQLVDRALMNVSPITKVDTRGWDPLLWQTEINKNRLHKDQAFIKLSARDLKRNASGYFEDYISVGPLPKTSS